MTSVIKRPPQAIELEQAILGAILLEKQGAYIGCKTMQPEFFYDGKHKTIFKACKELQDSGHPIDILTVSENLSSKGLLEGVGGGYYISKLTNSVSSSANLEFHCRIVQQKYVGRELIRIASQSVSTAYDESEDCFEAIEDCITELAKVSQELIGSNSKELSAIIDELDEQVSNNQKGTLPGIPTGVNKYDLATGGQQKGNLIIYAGRPGMGKTARACNELYHQLKKGYSVVFHSLEMPEREITARIVALECGIPPEIILKKRLTERQTQEYIKATKWLRGTSLKIFSSNKLSTLLIDTSMHKAMQGCDIVYVDYIQIIKTHFNDPTQAITEASLQLKQLAKTLNVPVVALAQLNRSVETRGGDKKPILSDLKQSGQIEQDADVVEFLYRPEYYGIETDDDGNSVAGQTHYINAKMRGGTPGITTVMKWEGAMNRLTDFDFSEPSFEVMTPIPTNDDFDNDDTPF